MQVLKSSSFWVILTALVLAAYVNLSGELNQSNTIMASDRPSLAQMSKQDSLMREGTPLTDIKGRFKKQGDRFLFVEDGTTKFFKCLENLCLQRVTTNLQDDDRAATWLISAKFTEFNDTNYLLVEKAVRSR
ncbi:MAG: hypothetical protein NTY15_05910 [Planctomycetota bacterium]|nr:hypothetical protein [Planctomycetota bacterium]